MTELVRAARMMRKGKYMDKRAVIALCNVVCASCDGEIDCCVTMEKCSKIRKEVDKIMQNEKRKKHNFLRRVVRLCLVMMVLLTVAAVVMAAVTGVPLDAGALGVLMGGWCGELLLTLLKRKFEQEDKENKENKENKEDGDAKMYPGNRVEMMQSPGDGAKTEDDS